jgi:NAD(P)-dependent dehydrogenase (short-subunit alcohol dehydrogenase family)
MKTIVITGSTRGIGYNLADAFLSLDCAVAINGRTPTSVESAVDSLSSKYSVDRVLGCPGDAANFKQAQSLWDTAKAHFGKIDLWINNAGIAHPQSDFWLLTPEQIEMVVQTNLVGAMYGSVVALRGMLAQGFGSLYNVEGLGSDGRRIVKGLALYASTKAGLAYFDTVLMQEAAGTPVLVGAIRPGMVATDMITTQYTNKPQEWERAKRILSIIADRPETVAPWIAGQVLANTKNGVRISYSSGAKVFLRFLTAPFNKRNVFD